MVHCNEDKEHVTDFVLLSWFLSAPATTHTHTHTHTHTQQSSFNVIQCVSVCLLCKGDINFVLSGTSSVIGNKVFCVPVMKAYGG